MSQKFYNALRTRAENMLNGDHLVSAIFLYLRYRILIDNDKNEAAKKHLLNIGTQITKNSNISFNKTDRMSQSQKIYENLEEASNFDKFIKLVMDLETAEFEEVGFEATVFGFFFRIKRFLRDLGSGRKSLSTGAGGVATEEEEYQKDMKETGKNDQERSKSSFLASEVDPE
ncbi:hypothetical protein BB558_007234 [Smittium angustum]|uniref:Uncharacterized protein n=1 Tax=Smittium angustum TaxID=133377 RepID=A0A2U1IVK7_SMIAN|nr:hypothetical protein BB558_007234 [Smittium angustum]